MSTASTPVEVRGRYFWRGNERFLIRGVVYQDYSHHVSARSHDKPPNDEIADDRLAQLEHDIGLFEELGINAIFVYGIDKTKCHDKAMKMLEQAGIYVLANVGTASRIINRLDPFASYSAENMSHFFNVADILSAYPNCLGLIAGNEIINNRNTLRAAPVLRAVVRDLKRYLRLKHALTGQRILPVGYSAAHTRELEIPTRDYLAAGEEAERLDFWSKNNYSWASPSNFQISGYRNDVQRYSDFNIPAFWSEYGTNVNPPRDFGEITALLSPKMTHVFSGGFAYEFWRHENDYGMVRHVKGKEASKWRRAYSRFEKLSTEGINREMSRMTLGEYVDNEDGGGGGRRDLTDDRGESRRLDRTVAEYRETSVGDIVLHKDFMYLKQKIAANKDVETNTDLEWADTSVTAGRAPEFPSSSEFPELHPDLVPTTCVDWQAIENRIRDEEYVLVSDEPSQ